ncbi:MULTISPECIES: LmeA family phospholipid-binding protein [unclassified Agromyces]|uniref:LmeA family phospholipid-binding protein n=1 Tax=unclassified Agromyces TaxID=2639701 RepID=UPI0030146315
MAASDAETVRLDPVARDDGPRRRTSGATRAAIVIGAIVVILAGVVLLVETVGRGIAERAVADSIERDLPEGVEGEVDVQILGFSALWQVITGRMDEMVATAPELQVQGVPVDVTVTARGVPLAEGGSVERAEVVASVDEAAIDLIAESQGIAGGVDLGDGTVSYSDEAEFLGVPVAFSVSAEPEAAGDRVLLTPVAAELRAGGTTLDASGLVERIVGGEPFPVCVADRLPEGVEVAGIEVTPDGATVRLEASDLPVAEETLATTGTCG